MKILLQKLLKVIHSLRFKFVKIKDEQFLSVNYISAEPGDCEIACIAMLADFYGGEIKQDWASLKNDANYIPEIGWKHDGLVNIAKIATQRKFKRFSYMNINFVRS